MGLPEAIAQGLGPLCDAAGQAWFHGPELILSPLSLAFFLVFLSLALIFVCPWFLLSHPFCSVSGPVLCVPFVLFVFRGTRGGQQACSYWGQEGALNWPCEVGGPPSSPRFRPHLM